MDIVLTAEQTAALDAAHEAVRIVDCRGRVVASLAPPGLKAAARRAPPPDGIVEQPRRQRGTRTCRSVLGRLVEVVRRIRARQRA